MDHDKENMGISYLPYPIIIYDIVSCIDCGCVTKILDVSPALYRLAADGVHKPGLYVSAYHDAGADVVETAFAIISCLESAIDQLVLRFRNNLPKTAW